MPYYPSRPERQPPEPRKGRPVRIVLLCVSVLLFLYGAVRLAGYGAELLASRRTTRELRVAAEEAAGGAPEETGTPVVAAEASASPVPAAPAPEAAVFRSEKLPEVPYPNGYALNEKIQKLRKKSRYIIGWIRMDELDEPVVMKDNSFFLNHDAMGNRNSNGAIFMDERTALLTRPYTVLLYGHNMKSGAMFGNLRKYEKFSFFYQHRLLQFDTLYEEGRYAVFAVAQIRLTPGRSRYLNLGGLLSLNRETRRKALDALIARSMHDPMLDVNEEDHLLLLVTCVGEEDERLVVAARRLRDGEREDHLEMPRKAELPRP